MYHTIQVSSCVSVQGEFVAALADGRIVVRDGATEYRGRPIVKRASAPSLASMAYGSEGAAHGA